MTPKHYLLLLALSVLAACATATVALPTQADVERGKTYYPNLTLEELNEGKMRFNQQCSKCHDYEPPASKKRRTMEKNHP